MNVNVSFYCFFYQINPAAFRDENLFFARESPLLLLFSFFCALLFVMPHSFGLSAIPWRGKGYTQARKWSYYRRCGGMTTYPQEIQT